MPIKFFFPNTKIYLTNRNKLKGFIGNIFFLEKKRLSSLTYVFCSDSFLLGINQRFLKHDFYTDIITFDLSEGVNRGISGEIYISTDRVRDNASSMGETVTNELLRVIFHGALHLCGYNDKKTADKKLMRQKEDYYLNLYLQFKINVS